ncbi:MAG: helix-turn-helix transcriptional regulator [Acidimicrobiia bacterium]|nr:helix-turn-helix transcriptional regulator [bacterium]MXX64347.1 helix-turn-helix transcriptional regulator [Acidimicrobiia bacterium]MCY3651428.1 helix-turn-helix transcriptional regulator [bacterium]MDE0643033.1 helix-turn-helix transcriptional regulator [bacterium]MXZ07565.1 helix-turn-helix transcriptional regulator [Acidimicrobiia bacterium]
MDQEKLTPELEAVYVISVAATLSGMHPQTLRIYERRGLIEPYRTPGGTRRYSAADLERLSLIQELTGQGINIEGVKRIMELEAENRELHDETRRLRRRLKVAQEAAITATEALERTRRRLRRGEILVRSDVLRFPDNI